MASDALLAHAARMFDGINHPLLHYGLARFTHIKHHNLSRSFSNVPPENAPFHDVVPLEGESDGYYGSLSDVVSVVTGPAWRKYIGMPFNDALRLPYATYVLLAKKAEELLSAEPPPESTRDPSGRRTNKPTKDR